MGMLLNMMIIHRTIGILTRDIIDRTEYYKHALIMALIPFMNESMY